MIVEKEFRFGEIKINFAEGPDVGPPILLLHGVTARWQAFHPLLPALTQTWHVYATDFRGHGRSSHTPGHYTIRDYTSDTLAFIRYVVGNPVVIFGHSLGGSVALHLAAEHPGMVSAVIVGDTPLSGETLNKRQDFMQVFVRWRELILQDLSTDELARALGALPAIAAGNAVRFSDLPGWDGAYLRYTAQYLKQVDPDVLASITSAARVQDNDLFPLLPRVECPVLFLQGNPALGALLTHADVERALALTKCSARVTIAGSGHDLHLQDAPSVLRAVMLFLNSLR